MFLDKVLHAVGHFFSGLVHKAKPFLEKEIPVVIQLLNGLKKGLDLMTTDPLKQMIQSLTGVVPMELLQKADALIPKAIIALGYAKHVADQNDTEAVLLAFLEAIKDMDHEPKALAITSVATLIVSDFADGKLTWDELMILIKKAYDEGINLHMFNQAIPDAGGDQPSTAPAAAN